mmetsp:Transcript_51578/g.81894  ORF Transcript_51578/g.81894 Transcript_51578/m.81894 type:complete len:562 (-) Transcript_51578:32-1717(-)|eukprot:CAMPEP_0169085484 /NCGR_PEP_ID=MMETSP1015-20121227/13187_1 /TAXON_ID=342587 /ORGANISM="Karlodinium micrum, Strain CCMP2283" /LENGTH=561 /DNA_ID=CAMNT_0009145579 /DNA_START=52 /DNA_END=1737 /DNA_ORIENTATION=+
MHHSSVGKLARRKRRRTVGHGVIRSCEFCDLSQRITLQMRQLEVLFSEFQELSQKSSDCDKKRLRANSYSDYSASRTRKPSGLSTAWRGKRSRNSQAESRRFQKRKLDGVGPDCHNVARLDLDAIAGYHCEPPSECDAIGSSHRLPLVRQIASTPIMFNYEVCTTCDTSEHKELVACIEECEVGCAQDPDDLWTKGNSSDGAACASRSKVQLDPIDVQVPDDNDVFFDIDDDVDLYESSAFKDCIASTCNAEWNDNAFADGETPSIAAPMQSCASAEERQVENAQYLGAVSLEWNPLQWMRLDRDQVSAKEAKSEKACSSNDMHPVNNHSASASSCEIGESSTDQDCVPLRSHFTHMGERIKNSLPGMCNSLLPSVQLFDYSSDEDGDFENAQNLDSPKLCNGFYTSDAWKTLRCEIEPTLLTTRLVSGREVIVDVTGIQCMTDLRRAVSAELKLDHNFTLKFLHDSTLLDDDASTTFSHIEVLIKHKEELTVIVERSNLRWPCPPNFVRHEGIEVREIIWDCRWDGYVYVLANGTEKRNKGTPLLDNLFASLRKAPVLVA